MSANLVAYTCFFVNAMMSVYMAAISLSIAMFVDDWALMYAAVYYYSMPMCWLFAMISGIAMHAICATCGVPIWSTITHRQMTAALIATNVFIGIPPFAVCYARRI